MASPLASKRCVACTSGTPPLTSQEIAPLACEVPDWQIIEDNKKLVRTFRFKNFAKAMEFVNDIARVAEEEGHHPDLFVSWGEVTVYLWTHKIGGLSEADFVMAAKIDRLYEHR